MHIIKKCLPSIAFVSKYHQSQTVFGKISQTFPVIHRCRRNLKYRDISFQCDQGMDLESKVGLFFGGTFSIICPILTERAAIACASKLTDRKREAVNYKITAIRNGKNKGNFLSEQFCNLQKISSSTVKTGSGT